MQQLESKGYEYTKPLKEVVSSRSASTSNATNCENMKDCNDQLKYMQPLKQFAKKWERSASNKNIENASAQLPWIFRSHRIFGSFV